MVLSEIDVFDGAQGSLGRNPYCSGWCSLRYEEIASFDCDLGIVAILIVVDGAL